MRNNLCGKLLVLLLPAILLTACVQAPPTPGGSQFDQAVRQMAANLRQQFSDAQSLVGRLKETRIVIVPFVDAESGEENQVSRDVERIVFEEFGRQSTRLTPLTIQRIDLNSFKDADHVMIGAFALEEYVGGRVAGEKRYHLYASIVDRATRQVVAHTDTWIAQADLAYKPSAVYENSPMYPRDRRLRSQVVIAKSSAGTQADKEYYDSLETNALLIEAGAAFEAGNYEHARQLFQSVSERPDGQVMKSYIGLYRANIKLGATDGAEAAFARMLAVGVANDELSAKFLFSVNSTDFISDAELRAQYALWVRQIALFFNSSARCLNIVGHSSRTGAAEYNEKLSLSRARRLQELMRPQFPKVMDKSRAYGRGYSENIAGSGADDASDAVDRRVEFAVVDCGS